MRTSQCYTTEQLAEYSVGGGSEKWRRHVTEHLTHCSFCRSEVAALERVDNLLDDMKPAEAPDLWDKIAPNLAPVRRPWYSGVVAVRRKVYAVTAAAAALAAFAVMVTVGPVGEKAPQDRAVKVEHVDNHTTMIWNDPFADKASLAVLAAEGVEEEM